MIEAYFSNIEQQIKKMLSVAEHQVLVAVAWFTNEVLYGEILKCLERRVPTSIIIMDDFINRNEFALDFTKFLAAGGKLYFSKGKKMHNKFCIIDGFLITGSYNWTYYAEKLNSENIIVIDDTSITEKYKLEYRKLQDSITPIANYESLKLKHISETDILSDYHYLCNDLFLKGPKYKDEIEAFNKEKNYKVKVENKESYIECDGRGVPLLKKDFAFSISRRRLINFSIGLVPYGRPHGGRKYVHAKLTSSSVSSKDYWVDIFDPEFINEVTKYFRKSEGGILDDSFNIVPIPADIYNPFNKYGFIPVHYIFYKFGKYGNKRRKYGINGNIIADKNGIPYEYDSFDTLIRYDYKTKKFIGFESKTELCHLIIESLFMPNGIDDYDIICDYFVENGVFRATIDDFERICRAEGTGMPNAELTKDVIKSRLVNNPEGFWLYKENSAIFSYAYGVLRDNYPTDEYQKSHNDNNSIWFVLLRLKASCINYNNDKFETLFKKMIEDLKKQGLQGIMYNCPTNQIQYFENLGFMREQNAFRQTSRLQRMKLIFR